MMDENKVVESVSESYDDSENILAGKKPRSRERGPDKKPRTYRANSMSNLTQFNQRPEEFAKYLKDEKGVDIGSDFNWNNTIVWILIGLVVVVGGIGIVKWWQQRQMKKQDVEPGGKQ